MNKDILVLVIILTGVMGYIAAYSMGPPIYEAETPPSSNTWDHEDSTDSAEDFVECTGGYDSPDDSAFCTDDHDTTGVATGGYVSDTYSVIEEESWEDDSDHSVAGGYAATQW